MPAIRFDKPAAHIVVRYSDKIAGGLNTIKEHRAIVRAQGHVWIGKIGRGLRLQEFQDQIADNIPTCLYLAKPAGGSFELTKCSIKAIQLDQPKQYLEAIPPYYSERHFLPRIGMWFLVRNLRKVDSSERRRLITRSSRRPVTETLLESSAGAFVVWHAEAQAFSSERSRARAFGRYGGGAHLQRVDSQDDN